MHNFTQLVLGLLSKVVEFPPHALGQLKDFAVLCGVS